MFGPKINPFHRIANRLEAHKFILSVFRKKIEISNVYMKNRHVWTATTSNCHVENEDLRWFRAGLNSFVEVFFFSWWKDIRMISYAQNKFKKRKSDKFSKIAPNSHSKPIEIANFFKWKMSIQLVQGVSIMNRKSKWF